MLLVLMFAILCAVACYALGASKGYSGGVCAAAGFFGGIIAIIIIVLLPDREEEAANAAVRDSTRDREIAELKKRIAQLEAAQKAVEPEPPTATPPSAAESPAPNAPAVFPARTNSVIACPRCGRKQKGNRDACYSCGTPFVYENE